MRSAILSRGKIVAFLARGGRNELLIRALSLAAKLKRKAMRRVVRSERGLKAGRCVRIRCYASDRRRWSIKADDEARILRMDENVEVIKLWHRPRHPRQKDADGGGEDEGENQLPRTARGAKFRDWIGRRQSAARRRQA
jgi:hypothetical protein